MPATGKTKGIFNTNFTICTINKNTTNEKSNLICNNIVKWEIYALPWLDVLQDDCCGSHFLSLDQWAKCSRTVHQTSGQPPPFFLCDDMAHTPPHTVSISKL